MSGRWIRASAIAGLCAAVLAGVPATASAMWERETTKNPSTTEDALLEVSCWSASECVAVGTYEKSGVPEPLAERLSGGMWTNEFPGSVAAVLSGVSCASSLVCIATGSTSAYQSIAYEYTSVHGWKKLALTLPGSAVRSELDRVSCPTTEMCMMVGVYETSGGERLSFAEKWTPSGVTLETTPGTAEAVLIGVSCVTTKECMAVGWEKGLGAVLSDRWSGGTWTQTTSATSSLSPLRLFGVDCLSNTVVECTAVGWGTKSIVEPMSEEWTEAGGWVAAKTSSPSVTKDLLAAVGCFSKRKCIGVGEQNEEPEALIEKLEGTSAAVETPATLPTGVKTSRLLGLSCQVGGSKCMAVGYYVNTSGIRQTLAEHN
jgi:hypothetical protein